MKKGFALVVVFAVAFASAVAQQPSKSSWINGPIYDGTPITCDLPNDQQMRNIGSRIDRAGMCVFTSIEHAARYQGIEDMRGWRDWCAKNYRGGGYPEKVDKLLAAWWKHKGIAPIPYLQFEGKDPEQLMSIIDRTNRMASLTYGFGPRYGVPYIAHMVNGILYGEKYATVLDNNFPFDNAYEWMGRAELIRRARLARDNRGRIYEGSAWVFVWLGPGSPPPPKAPPPRAKARLS